MVDYVVYAAPGDESITRAMVTMLQPLTGVRIMVAREAPPAVSVGQEIPLFAIWSQEAARDGFGAVFAKILASNPGRAVVVALLGTPVAPELAALRPLVVNTVSDAAKDSASIGAALKAARVGMARDSGVRTPQNVAGEKTGISPLVLALGGLGLVALVGIGAMASVSVSSSVSPKQGRAPAASTVAPPAAATAAPDSGAVTPAAAVQPAPPQAVSLPKKVSPGAPPSTGSADPAPTPSLPVPAAPETPVAAPQQLDLPVQP